MTTIVDYVTLKSAIADFAHRPSDLANRLDLFVAHANSQINRRLRCRQMEQAATISSTTKHFILPADFLELRAIYTDQGQIPALMSPAQFNSRGLNPEELAYYIYSSSVIIQGPSGDNQNFEIIYYGKLADLVNDTDSNAVLETYPQLYLYGAMAEYARFAEEDTETRAHWNTLFLNEIEEINRETRAANYSGSPLSMRVY